MPGSVASLPAPGLLTQLQADDARGTSGFVAWSVLRVQSCWQAGHPDLKHMTLWLALCKFKPCCCCAELGEGSLDSHRGATGGSKGSVYEPEWGEGSDKEEQPDAELLLRMFL